MVLYIFNIVLTKDRKEGALDFELNDIMNENGLGLRNSTLLSHLVCLRYQKDAKYVTTINIFP